MLNGDPPPTVPTLSTDMIQKCLEENKELIVATLEGQNQGKFAEVSECLDKLRQNLTYLAKLADAAPQAQIPSQGQGMRHPHVAMSQQQDLSTLNLPFDMNDREQQQQHQHHLAMSLQQPDLSTSKLPFQMNEPQHKLPPLFRQHQQLIPGPMAMGNFAGTNSGIYQAAQTRLSNLSDLRETNQIGSDVSPGWSLGKSPSGTY